MTKSEGRICLKLNQKTSKWVRSIHRSEKGNSVLSLVQFCHALIAEALKIREVSK